jgi:hypothetical protein
MANIVVDAKKQAVKEILEEDYRALVEQEKTKLRNKKSWWDNVFPFKIIIIRKEGA